MNITDILTVHARTRPDHPAIEDGTRIISYGECDVAASDVATNLQASGIEAGDIVAVMLPDSADHLVILCALARAGAVIFSLNPSLPKDVMEKSLNSVPVKAAITHTRDRRDVTLKCLTVEDICRPASGSFAAPGTPDDHPVMLVQTSGTTGAPKTFVRSHAETIDWIRRYAKRDVWIATDRCLSRIAMFFNTGRNHSLGMLHVGATVVINHARSPDELVRAVRDKRVTYLKLTSSHLLPLLDYAADRSPLFPDLRAMVAGSAPLTHGQRMLVRKRLAPNFVEEFSINEAGLVANGWPADQDAFPDAVGRVVEDIEVQIVDADHRPLPAGEIGLVRLRGAGYPTHYLDDPEATARAFRDGWFYPGDLAALNDQGYLFFKGRADDVINNSGVKFYPFEVENTLLAHPDVAEAAVFGWPHRQSGEVPVACVVTRSDISKLKLEAFCTQRMVGFKVPKIYMAVQQMPKNPAGKILKSELKEILRRNLASRSS